MALKNDIELAIKLASEAHSGQLDKGGMPYILHVLRVGLSFQEEDLIIAGILHNIVEDTPVRLHELAWRFNIKVVDAVDAMTRRKGAGESYWDYINRVALNPLGAKIKRADLLDNMLPWRQTFPGWESLQERHLKALAIINHAIEIHKY